MVTDYNSDYHGDHGEMYRHRESLCCVLGTDMSCPVVSGSLQPRGLQHSRRLLPSPNPGVHPSYVNCLGDVVQPSHHSVVGQLYFKNKQIWTY